MRSPAAVRSTVAVLLAALLLAGCSATADGGGEPTSSAPAPAGAEDTGDGEHDPTGAQTGQDTAPDDAGTQLVAGSLSGTDLAWLQLMAPMNERTLLLLGLVTELTGDTSFAGFADDLAATHSAEAERMRTLLAEAGVPDTNPHEGHDMTGMVTDEELAEIEAAAEFDDAALAALREHLEQSAMLSRSARDAGTDRDTTALADELAELRATQLTELEGLGG
ncbi:DUF305 domain-containing protein [Streptomyces sp. SM12]|uniref:DUF305 domain-containing protein n=1 Tax=Streptomyces sp. SM12 TaxID=1071602 RepID=UPI0011B0D284|nr:DUF305 domain-containing protein [Streptomyces sp. SM12]